MFGSINGTNRNARRRAAEIEGELNSVHLHIRDLGKIIEATNLGEDANELARSLRYEAIKREEKLLAELDMLNLK